MSILRDALKEEWFEERDFFTLFEAYAYKNMQ